MSIQRIIIGVLLVAAVGVALTARGCRGRHEAGATESVRSLPFQVWTVCGGVIESRDVHTVMSQLEGPASVVELAPDAAIAAPGDVLVRFDASQWEREAVRLERDYRLAMAERTSLANAKLPIELQEMEARLTDARRLQAREEQALTDNRQLAAEKLIPEQEVVQQEGRAEGAKKAAEAAARQVELTKQFVHPSILERADATLESAAQELFMARRQLSNCVVRAVSAGTVALKPVSIGGEYRPARVGDTLFRNQPFLTVSDMSNLVMRADVPESDLLRMQPGAEAVVKPLANPDLSVKGRVESIGTVARTAPGRPGGQKYFAVVIRLEAPGESLRAGMSAEARILTYSRGSAVVIPRTAVWWENDQAYCRALRGSRADPVPIVTGPANATHVEVISGVEPGDTVVVR